MDSTPLVCVTGQVRSHLIGTDAFQECDITGITIPIVKHSWLVQDVEELPHAIKAAFHIASTGRCGPGPRRHPARHPGGGARLSLSGRDRSARLAPRCEREREAGAGGGAGDRRRAAARALRRRRDDQRRGLRRAPPARRAVAAPGRDDAHGQERLPRDARPALRLAGHARGEVVELGDEQVRRAGGGRGALRRPRHRQALRVRAGSHGRPPRRRRRRDREAAACGHSGRGAAEADPRRARRRVRGAERPGRQLPDPALARPARRLARGVPAPLRRRRRHAQAPARARDAAGRRRAGATT